MATVLDKIVSIKAQLDDRQIWVDRLDNELSGLRAEARYHEMQKELLSLRSIEVDFGRVERAYEDLVGFGESRKRTYANRVSSTLTEELKVKTPGSIARSH